VEEQIMHTESSIQRVLAMFFDPRKHLIVPNVSHSFFNHECDLLVLSAAGYATEIEIKISASDLKRDFAKRKHERPRPKMIRRLFYAVPTNLVELAIDLVPQQYGIIEIWDFRSDYSPDIIHHKAKIIRRAKNEKNASCWGVHDTNKLLRNLSIKYWYHAHK
jgi:hypothetical protein